MHLVRTSVLTYKATPLKIYTNENTVGRLISTRSCRLEGPACRTGRVVRGEVGDGDGIGMGMGANRSGVRGKGMEMAG